MRNFKNKLAAVLIAVLMLSAIITPCVSATVGTVSQDEEYTGWTDIPLLVIKVNYEPVSGTPTYCATKDDTMWYNTLFSKINPKSLWTFYDIASLGRFHFTPATENYVNAETKNVANDGIVEVTINYNHSAETNITSSNDRNAAASAAAEYVDFKSFDKNENGRIDKGELAICFLCAGLEATRAGTTATPSVHAFYAASAISVTTDSGSVGIYSGFVKFGEMCNSTTPNTVGTFCHELGHYLGTYDLYVNKSWGGANSPAGKVSVMAGSGSAGKNSDEATGQSPSNLDAFHITYLGFQTAKVIGDGEYTLYSRQSTKGAYTIYRINTPNPKEYYLIENRYFDKNNKNFDSETNWDGTRGIIIWHVDEDALAQSGNLTANNGTEIAVSALSPNSPYPYNSGVFGVEGQIFDSTSYIFPGSGYWSTGLTEGQEGSFNLKIEIESDAGHEMNISVSGSQISMTLPDISQAYTVGTSAVTVMGQINDMRGQTLNGVKVLLSAKEDMSDAKTVDTSADGNGTFTAEFTGLEAETKYYTRVILNMDTGDFPFNRTVTTRSKNLDESHYTISYLRGLTSPDKAFSQKVEVGAPVKVSFPMKKAGYTFGGWYLDSAYTRPFNLALGKNDNENITLYAKWIEDENVVTLKFNGAEPQYTYYPISASESFEEPEVKKVEGKVFAGWFADPELTIEFGFGDTVDVAGTINVYAKWDDAPKEMETTAPVETTTNQTETTSTETQAIMPEKSNSTVTIIIIIAVVAVAAVLVYFLVIKKKK